MGDFDRDAWRCAVSLLMSQGGMSEPAARRYFGKLLAEHNLEARDLLPAVTSALVNRSQDPKSYLAKSATSLAKRRSGPEPAKRVDWV